MSRAALPNWPRLMCVDLAAAYLGLGVTTLREKGPAPKEYGKRRLYDRIDLDRWADRLGGQPLTVAEQQAEADETTRRWLEKRRARN
jgi:hypothetical protein